jgi:hypothetical protein
MNIFVFFFFHLLLLFQVNQPVPYVQDDKWSIGEIGLPRDLWSLAMTDIKTKPGRDAPGLFSNYIGNGILPDFFP